MDEKNLVDHSVGSGNSRIPADQETRITIRDDEVFEDRGGKRGVLDEKSKGLMLNKELRDGLLRGEEDQCSCADDKVKFKKLETDSQRFCRICHLNRLEDEKDGSDLMELGCGCRGELGVVHPVCAEAWFKLRGNRLCEICGQTAKNVSGISDSSRFMEEWNENGSATDATTSAGRRCWNDQPLCNFLMACVVLAFVLPWFFRINMF